MAADTASDHTSISNATDFYICEFCNFSTNRMVTFTAHIGKCADKFPNCFTCSKCIYQSKEFTEFQEHCKTHIVSTKLFNCQYCSFVSVSQTDFTQHSNTCSRKIAENNSKIEKNDTSASEFDCRECDFYCNSSEKFEHHMSARHSVVWDYSCFHCNYKVQSYSLFSTHISRYHPEVLAPDQSDSDVVQSTEENANISIKCLHCNYSSESQVEVHEHMKRKHNSLGGGTDDQGPNKRVKLDTPENNSSPEQLVPEHIPTVYKPRRKKYACCDCPYKTNGHSLYLRHRKAHTSSMAYFCNSKPCLYKTVSLALMKKHMRNVHDRVSQSFDWKVFKNGVEQNSDTVFVPSELKCDQCSYHCNSLVALRNHKKVHSTISIKCDHCDYITRNRKFMNKHISSRHPETEPTNTATGLPKQDISIKYEHSGITFKFSKCDICGFIARSRKNLDKHVIAHNANFNYKCPHCLFINTCFKTFRIHMNKFHPREKITMKRNPLEKYEYQCDKCNYETNNLEKLEKHKIDHEEGRFYHCEICKYIAVSHIRLGKHIKLKHPQTLLKKCAQCEYTTNRSKNFKAHLQAHKDSNAYKCLHCYFLSSSYRSFCTHMSSRHPEEENTTTEEVKPTNDDAGDPSGIVRQLYKCDKCLYSSNREAVLDVHLKAHNNPNCLKCEHCYFITTHKYALEKHLYEKHSIKKTYSCPKCEFTTKRMQFFRNHTKAHESKYSYRCCICSFLTLNYSSYCNHMKCNHPDAEVMKEKKPGNSDDEGAEDDDMEIDEESDDDKVDGFSCEQCSFTTNNPKSMESHAKAHASDKAIKCELCDYMTVSSSCYKSHVRNNHPQSKLKAQLYKCAKCEFTTGNGPLFKSHVKAHGCENNYQCKHCPYLTVFYHSICTHMLKSHPEKENDIIKHDAPEGYIRKEKKEYKYYCSRCSFKCMYYKLYCNHIEIIHPGAKNEYEAEHEKKKLSKESDKLYFCKSCEYSTDIAIDMEEHLPSHTPDLYYVCRICSYQKTGKDSFIKHVMEEHQANPDTMTDEANAFYICPCCAFKTSSIETYNIHLVAHPLKEKVKIEMKTQSAKSGPKENNFQHYNAICEICGFKPVNPKQLEYHMLAHQSESSYDCEHCLYKTINRQSFRKHAKVSHGITLPLGRPRKGSDETSPTSSKNKPERYKCQDCGFENNSISSHKNHMDAHLSPNSLKCPHCLYRTLRWVNLKSHLVRIHPSEAKAIKREDIPGASLQDPSIDDAVLYNSPTMFRTGPYPFSSTPHAKSNFPTIDSFTSEPVMMPRAVSEQQVVTEEVVISDTVDTWEPVDDEISF